MSESGRNKQRTRTQAQPAQLESFIATRPSRAERMEQGRQSRQQVPRSAHAAYTAGRSRKDPVEILQGQNRARVKKLVPVRNARMLASPFAFFRGSAAIMAGDLARTPVTGLDVVACGDMHVANFGIFGSAERNLIFAINDFDEVHPGPWEWDLKRLAASAAIAALHMGGGDADGEEAVRAAVAAYRKRIRGYAEMGYLEVWYDRIDERAILDAAPPRLRDGTRKLMRKARSRGHVRTLDKLAEVVDGEHRIVEDVPLIVRETRQGDGTPIEVALEAMLESYVDSLADDRRLLLSKYRIVDVARKVVGVGSVGTSCWVVMLKGADDADPLFLQVKQATASVLQLHVAATLPFSDHGRRVVAGQRIIQGSPDIFLGWGSERRGHFYVRQLADMKGGIELPEDDRAALNGFPDYCGLCGWALALAHAKSGDAAAIAGYCGRSEALDEAISAFALLYAKQNARDYEKFTTACRKGKMPVARES